MIKFLKLAGVSVFCFIAFAVTLSLVFGKPSEKPVEIKPIKSIDVSTPVAPQSVTASVVQSPKNQPPQSQSVSKKSQSDNEVLNNISAQLATYKLPIKSGKWQTCILEKINVLDNFQLLSFYDWFKSLSPYASEVSTLTAVSRKFGCPDPVTVIIPAKTEIIKSFSGTGSQSLGTVVVDNSISKQDWYIELTWSNSPLNENFGAGTVGIDGEEIQFRRAQWNYGIVNYPETSNIITNPYVIGFYSPTGSNQENGELLGVNSFDYLRVKSPNQAQWKVEIRKIIEPSKTIIE